MYKTAKLELTIQTKIMVLFRSVATYMSKDGEGTYMYTIKTKILILQDVVYRFKCLLYNCLGTESCRDYVCP